MRLTRRTINRATSIDFDVFTWGRKYNPCADASASMAAVLPSSRSRSMQNAGEGSSESISSALQAAS